MKETTPLLVIFFPPKAHCRKTFKSPDGLTARGVGPIYFHILKKHSAKMEIFCTLKICTGMGRQFDDSMGVNA